MQISIDTELDTFDDVVKTVNAAYGQVLTIPLGSVEVGADEDGGPAGNWTPPLLRRMVEWLGDSDAAVALRFIAENAPAVSLEDAFNYMSDHTGIENFNGKAMGGRMSAIGFARNSIGGGVGPLYDTDYTTRKYRMDESVAAALLQEMGEVSAE